MDETFRPLDKRADIDAHRRNLPHWSQPGCTYFVTFRTADALPQSKLKEMRTAKNVWLEEHPEPWSENDKALYDELFTERMQIWLDAGYGACALGEKPVQKIMASALKHFDGSRYLLDEFVVMPNHVHMLIKPSEKFPLNKILHSVKSFTANRINTLLRQSDQFWMDESFDHAVRSWDQLEHFRRYIQENPKKAILREGKFLLGKGCRPIQKPE